MAKMKLIQRLSAEALGTAFLLATVIGSGIMADKLSGGNVALALLGNTLATGAILVVLITMFGPLSGAHFNPAVSLIFFLRKDLPAKLLILYICVQIIGGVIGVWSAHAMFDETIWQLSSKVRTGPAQWFSEWVATFGLVITILLTLRVRPEAIPVSVGLYITAAYWFTASTSFANPAVTLARGFSNTFAGIRPDDILIFILAQTAGALCALFIARFFDYDTDSIK